MEAKTRGDMETVRREMKFIAQSSLEDARGAFFTAPDGASSQQS
jgi:hypothetical protein